jgi:isoquinoline 1-oxidoreductase
VRVDGDVEVVRVVTAFECGAVIHPENLRNQIAGATLMGLSGALFEQVRFGDGRILNPRFSQYRVARFTDVPEVDVVIVDRPDLPSAGGGETPIIAIAPALANAIFAATGRRIRSLPLLGSS